MKSHADTARDIVELAAFGDRPIIHLIIDALGQAEYSGYMRGKREVRKSCDVVYKKKKESDDK